VIRVPAIDRERQYDVVLFGATGFVGRLVARYLAIHAPAGTRIALAGRNLERLRALRRTLEPAAEWATIVVDAFDVSGLRNLACSARTVATAVGPYARDGFALAESCANAGTHYADLTGEVLFVRRCADALHDVAEASGARLVHACGYDAIPSDLAVLLTHRQAQADGAGQLSEAVLVARGHGGVSGGTIESLRVQLHEVQTDPSLRQLLDDPYTLSPDRTGEADLGPQPDIFRPYHDPLAGGWIAPFVMGLFNSRIVRRSNALSGWAYGHDLRYRESTGGRPGPFGACQAIALAAAQAAGVAAVGSGTARSVLDRVLPRPGQGPSERTRRTGSFTSTVFARTTSGARYRCVVGAHGDPGYAATSVMLGEAALCLALDGDLLPSAAGVLTPATAMGTALATRLRAAGFVIEATAQ